MSKKISILESFVCGILGALFFALFLILLGATPKHMNDKWMENAIKHGYAHWEMSNNNPPVIEFKWNNDK